jgi:phage FluMu protein Com
MKLGILTLCDKCHKEIPLEFEESAVDFVANFAKCPHCKHVNHRWLRFPKNLPWTFIEKQKLVNLVAFFEGYPSDLIPRSVAIEKVSEVKTC